MTSPALHRRATGSAPSADAGRRSSLTHGMLVKFGAVIAAAVVALAGVAIWGSRSQSSNSHEAIRVNDVKASIRAVGDAGNNIRRYLLGVALVDQLGADWVGQRKAALQELYPKFDAALDAAMTANLNAEIESLLDDVRTNGRVFVNDAKFVADHWADFESSDPVVVAAVKASFNELDAAFTQMQEDQSKAEELIEARATNAEGAADDASSLMIQLVVAAALLALGIFGFVWRKVLKAADQMNAMQAEVARTAAMVEGSPTATLFADPSLAVQYANPAALATMRRHPRLFAVSADEIVGSPLERFHGDRGVSALLADPARNLPHTSVVQLGDEQVELNLSSIEDGQGASLGIMVTWALVTDQRRLEREAEEARERERTQAAELRSKVDSMLSSIAAAAAGDLTVKVEVSGDDAIGQMGTALSKLLADLRRSIGSIADHAQTLSAAAEELQVVSVQMGANSSQTSDQVGRVSHASQEVARNVETVSSGAEEMSASIKEIARNAAEAAEVAAQAVAAAKSTNDTVAKLGDSSTEIGEIVKVITSIAQQTNLLALNATIEAARAGEAGKGFAVVAGEVKELAKATATATEDIASKIETIQDDTQHSVESIIGIAEIIDQISAFQNTIASAVEQQAATTAEIARSVTVASEGTAQINDNMAAVSHAADSTAAGATDSQRAATEVARMASDLQELVGTFTY